MNTPNFTDGSTSDYAKLPVEVAYLKWTRGNALLAASIKTDPAAYLGGWSAFVMSFGDNPTALPPVPLPVVQRVSQDGRHPYQVYAAPVINFFPVQARTRFELRKKEKEGGREIERVVAISRTRREGFTPYRQVFGLLYPPDMSGEPAPAVLKVWKWSTFISFEKAGREWNRVKVPTGKVLVRRYGTDGAEVDGMVVPKFNTFGGSQATPIEAIGLNDPIFVDLTSQMIELFNGAQDWANCQRWHSERGDEIVTVSEREFRAKCAELQLTDGEIAQILHENGGDYETALAAITGDAINAALTDAEREDESF